MKMLRLIRAQHGMTLPTIIVAMGIASIVMYGLMSGMVEMFKGKRSVDLLAEAQMVTMEMRMALRSQAQCQAALGGMPLNATSFTPVPLGSGLTLNMGGIDTTFASGALVPNNPALRFTRLDLQVNSMVPMTMVPLNVGGTMIDHQQVIAHLIIQLEKTQDGMIAQAMHPQSIPLQVLINPTTNQIATCNVDTAVIANCQALGRAWDAVNNRCTGPNLCQYGGTFSDPAAAGKGGFPNSVTNAYSCPSGYDQRRAGSITFASSCGKNCFNNETFATYECIYCTDGSGAPIAAGGAPVGVMSSGLNLDPDEAEANTEYASQYNSIWTMWGAITLPTPTPVPTPVPTPTPTPPPYPTGACDYTNLGAADPTGQYYCECTFNYMFGSICYWQVGSSPYPAATATPVPTPTPTPVPTPPPGAPCATPYPLYCSGTVSWYNIPAGCAGSYACWPASCIMLEQCTDGSRYVNGAYQPPPPP